MRKIRPNNWHDVKTKTYICEICGKEFTRSAYVKYKYCSVECSYLASRGNTRAKGSKPNRTTFTSDMVRGSNNPHWKEPILFICEHCKKLFGRKPWEVRRTEKLKAPFRFCSRACFTQSGVFKGEKSVNYVSGKKSHRGRSWAKQRTLTIERDKGACILCSKYLGNKIPVHHIVPFREFKSEESANKLDNLVCMCQSCHMKAEPRKRTVMHAQLFELPNV